MKLKVKPSKQLLAVCPRTRAVKVIEQDFRSIREKLKQQHPELSAHDLDNLTAHVLHLHPAHRPRSYSIPAILAALLLVLLLVLLLAIFLR